MPGICAIAFVLISAIVIWWYNDDRQRENKRKALKDEENAKREEERRIRECALSVNWLASRLGYIARDVVSRDELANFVDEGFTAEEIEREVIERIYAYDGISLGVHKGTSFPVKLKQDFRDRHVYVLGKSGSGKTTLLQQMILRDMKRGNGIGVIAPEQEMITEDVLPFVPENRIEDVVYFNPADEASPVSINPLCLEMNEDLHRRADENMAIFSRLLGNEGTPRMNEILRQTFYALLPLPGTTLLDIPKLLDRENARFRNHIVGLLTDKNCVHFWKDTYPQLPKNAHLPLVYRLSRLTQPKFVRNVLCQTGQSISFRDIMDGGKIALFNLSDGILGEQSSQLLGQLIVSKFQLAAMGRADTPKKKRRRFYLYIDEFQSFTSTASISYEKMLSRARKYRLALILAHQQTGQLPPNLLRDVLGNVSTVVSFALSSSDSKRIAPELISTSGPEIERTSPETLVSLRVGETRVKIGSCAFPMNTLIVEQAPNFRVRKEAITASRWRYGVAELKKEPSDDIASGPPTFDVSEPGKTF